MPTCVVDNQSVEQTVYAVIGGRRIDMCLWHWAAWARRGETAYSGILRWLNWQKPVWKHGDANYQLVWEGGQVVGKHWPSRQLIRASNNASEVLAHIFALSPGTIRVEPIGNNPPYPLYGTVTYGNGFKMLGYGRQSAFQASPQGNFSDGLFFFGESTETGDALIADIRIIGARGKFDSWAFHGRPARNVHLKNLEIYNFGWQPRSAYDPPAPVHSSDLTGKGRGWKCIDCSIYDCDYDGVMVAGAHDLEIRNCVFAHNAQKHGEGLLNYESGDVRTWAVHNVLAVGCVSRYCGAGAPAERYNIAGLQLRGGSAPLVDDYLSEGGGSQGLLLFDSRGAVTRNSIIRNVERYAGLWYEGCPEGLIDNVLVENISGDVGIVVGTWEQYRSHGTVVQRSRVRNTGSTGITTDCSRVTIVECEADRCGLASDVPDYEKAGFMICGEQDNDSKLLRSRARNCKYGFSDTRRGAGTGRKAIVLDCDFRGCQSGMYIGQDDPQWGHILGRNLLP